jgi:hypothetical protein
MKKTIETFRTVGDYELRELTQLKPSCFNGMVRVHKTRVTVERIEEPDDVIRGRIQELWDKCNNWHDREPLLAMATTYGMKLT